MRQQPPDTVNVGRKTPFGNPVRMNQRCPVCFQTHKAPAETLPCYQRYLRARISDNGMQFTWSLRIAQEHLQAPIPKNFKEELRALSGKTLYCPGCGVDSPTCHARILETTVADL